MSWIIYDGKLVNSTQPVLTASNRGFRYGDGIFETMLLAKGKIRLELYHMERLFTGMSLLGIDPDSLSEESIHSDIAQLTEANNCRQSARIRLAVYRNENNSAGYVVEAMPLHVKKRGSWTTDVYPYARKTVDAFANLKSANFLPYVMAGKYANDQQLDEAFVLNSEGNICDGSHTNVFLVHNSRISTPALHQGCVNGVMRRHVIESLKEAGAGVHQIAITEEHLLEADEIFLTNAIIGIQPVARFSNKNYTTEITTQIMEQLG